MVLGRFLEIGPEPGDALPAWSEGNGMHLHRQAGEAAGLLLLLL